MSMGFPKGETIKLLSVTYGAEDDFGNAIETQTEIEVDNVLVYPTTTADAINTYNLHGKHSVYTLCIPKGDANNWENAEVILRGKKYRTIGIAKEYTEANLPPLDWNKQIEVERYE